MTAEITQKFAALERQAQTLMGVFTRAGHEAVAPAVIQPADVFLDVIGESLRANTYVFTDPDGAELCLRPDLTVPTCRLHIARNGDARTRAKYCYNGPAFRFLPQGASAAHPREFQQAGVERFGDVQREAAEVDTIAILVSAIEAAGLKRWDLRIGDRGLFDAVLDAVGLPARWKRRLLAAFERPGGFRSELRALVDAPGYRAAKLPAKLASALTPDDPEKSEAALAAYLDGQNIEVVGARTLAEMTEHVLDIIADRNEAPLDARTAALIDSYVSVTAPALEAADRITKLLQEAGGRPGAALDAFDRRIALVANAGIELDRVTYSAEFGRNFAYYTGLVFELTAPRGDTESAIAGGGRYDKLLKAAGAPSDVQAVGGAIHTERLLQAVGDGA